MPWTGKQFAAKHNHALKGKAATKAAAQATAMVKAGVDEGTAIATANKHAGASPKSEADHMASRKRQGLSYREVAGEFSKPKSTAHRQILRQGFVKQGSAR